MKSFFYKKTLSPNIEMRNKLLRKLYQLRTCDDKAVELLKRDLRWKLKETSGSTEYYRFERGIKLYVGDDLTSKRNFLAFRDPDTLDFLVKDFRAKQKIRTIQNRERFVGKVPVVYQKSGGVITEPGTYLVANKKIKRNKVFTFKRPQTKDDYIGLEMEFASKLSLDTVADLICEANLHNSVRVMRDGSITTTSDYPFQVEICVLSKFTELAATLEKLKHIINVERFKVNESCGLHVHLDARSGNVPQQFQNLAAVQSVLFNLVDESRRENRYCHPVTAKTIDESNINDHYAAISSFSYYKHRTIEVRIHHSTLDFNLVLKWVKLLKKIAEYDGPPLQLGTFSSEFQQLKDCVKIDPELIDYIEERKSLWARYA